MSEPLLLLGDSLGADLHKGRSDRNGLVQQIITYVRDGRTVTRKQWVRSEFADHAKKNEEEKRDNMAHQEERKDKARKNKQADEDEKHRNADRRAHIKHLRAEEKSTHSHQMHHTIEQVKKLGKQEHAQEQRDEKKRRSKAAHKRKEAKSAYGQADQTKLDNRSEQNTSTGYSATPKK